MRHNNDIQINGNVIGGRQGWAYTCNSMKITVLKVDLDKEQEYKDYQTFEMVNVIWNYHGEESRADGQLECEKGEWSIGGFGACLHSQFTFSDMFESIESSNRQVIREGQIVALALFSKSLEVATLSLYKVGKVNIHCQTMAHLIPLTDEEMQEVKKNANDWCNR